MNTKPILDFCPVCLGRDCIVKPGEPDTSPCPNPKCWQGIVKRDDRELPSDMHAGEQ